MNFPTKRQKPHIQVYARIQYLEHRNSTPSFIGSAWHCWLFRNGEMSEGIGGTPMEAYDRWKESARTIDTRRRLLTRPIIHEVKWR